MLPLHPNFLDYVSELFETLNKTPRQKLKEIEEELDNETPEPLHSMLQKTRQNRSCKEIQTQKKNKETAYCPPTCTGTCNTHALKQLLPTITTCIIAKDYKTK